MRAPAFLSDRAEETATAPVSPIATDPSLPRDGATGTRVGCARLFPASRPPSEDAHPLSSTSAEARTNRDDIGETQTSSIFPGLFVVAKRSSAAYHRPWLPTVHIPRAPRYQHLLERRIFATAPGRGGSLKKGRRGGRWKRAREAPGGHCSSCAALSVHSCVYRHPSIRKVPAEPRSPGGRPLVPSHYLGL